MDISRNEFEALLSRLDMLERELRRVSDRDEIENLISTYQYFFSAGLGERIVSELWAHSTDDVSNEFGASGVYEGLRKLATYYEKDLVPGRYSVHAMTTPCIEVYGDTAQGLWTSIGTETDAGELGSRPPENVQERMLLTSETADGKAYKSEWVWQRYIVDFIREDGGWRIQRLHACEILRCPFDESWVTFAEKRFALDGIRIDAEYTSNKPYPPDVPHENHASRATSYHWQYTTDALPPSLPAPPRRAVRDGI